MMIFSQLGRCAMSPFEIVVPVMCILHREDLHMHRIMKR